jgi:hypothetical protein
MTGSKNDNETLAAAPDALLTAGKDATIELSEAELSGVSGGTDKMKQLQDMTSNAAMTGQKPLKNPTSTYGARRPACVEERPRSRPHRLTCRSRGWSWRRVPPTGISTTCPIHAPSSVSLHRLGWTSAPLRHLR